MLKYQRLDSSAAKNNNKTKTSTPTAAATTLLMNTTATTDEEDDDENYALYTRDNPQHQLINATTTTTKRTNTNATEGLSLFDELNNCHVNAAIAADTDMEHITMEVPLLSNNNNQDHDPQHNYHIDHCRADQPGFGANLINKSTQEAKFKIIVAISLCCIFMLIEFVGGYIAGSLAIMTDAAHLASDCITFIIGLVAIWLGSRPPDAKMTFGYKRMEVLGAIISVLGIWILTATLVAVAIQRVFTNDYDLDANAMMTISGIGIIINIVMVFILHGAEFRGGSHGHSHAHAHAHSHAPAGGGYTHLQIRTRHVSVSSNSSIDSLNAADNHQHTHHDTQSADMSIAVPTNVNVTTATTTAAAMPMNGDVWREANKHDVQHQRPDRNINLRAAMIHVIGDLVQSIGVFLASIFIKCFPNAKVADPLCTLLFSVIVILTTVHLFKDSIYILMDSVPSGFKLNELERDLSLIDGVKSVHHLNVWNHTANYSVLMVHLIIDFVADNNQVLAKATKIATSHKYNIKHCTIQIERLTS